MGHMENIPDSLARTPFHAILLWGDQSKSLRVLIDYGADESFLDTTLTSELNIPTQPLSIPMDVRVLEGRSIGRVTHNTTPINLYVCLGTTAKSIQFLLIKSPLIPVVLGFSWLPHHNSLLNWSTGAIIGWSPFCHAHCLNSAQPAPGRLLGGSEGAPDLTAIPAGYQDLREVFSKARATSLPPPRTYDCRTDRLTSTPTPRGCLYSLSGPETKAMETYIGDSLAAGLICPYSSPAGAWFFFAPVHRLQGSQLHKGEEPLRLRLR